MKSPRVHIAGSALISTLLVIVVLTIIVTAFLQSMTVERQTARSYLNRLRASLAADAAFSEAASTTTDLFYKFPDSATAWTKFANTQGTTFYYHADNDGAGSSVPSQTTAKLYALFLGSGALPAEAASYSEGTAFDGGLPTDTNESVNLNVNSDLLRPPGGAGDPALINVRWVEILEDPDKPRDLKFDSGTNQPINPPVARFAWWVEDESFRVNVNVAGSKARGNDTVGSGPAQGDLQGTLSAAKSDIPAAAIVQTRSTLPGHEYPSAVEVAQLGNNYDQFKAVQDYVTAWSSGLNLSRYGAKRLNLNEVVKDSIAPGEIRAQLDRILAAIKNDGAMPDFGQRFYQVGPKPVSLNASRVSDKAAPPDDHADAYLQKIAANIRDYIDTDSQPTIVNRKDHTIRIGEKPVTAIGFDTVGNSPGDNDASAIGKEAVPALEEYALRIKLDKMEPPKGGKQAAYQFETDHYFEFINPTNKDIPISALGEDAFLRVYNVFRYDAGGSPIFSYPVEIPLRELINGGGAPLTSFPAGKCVVLTTDPTPSEILCPDQTNVYHPSEGLVSAIKDRRSYSGTTIIKDGEGYFTVKPMVGTTDGRAGTTQTDYDIHVVLGNSAGIIDSFTGCSIPQNISISGDPKNFRTDTAIFRGGSLRGNSGTQSQSGDARSLNEQLTLQRYLSPSDEDQTRFFNSNLNTGSVPADSTVGRFNDNYVDASKWPDLLGTTIFNYNSANTAPGVIADHALDSIGQLGDVYDPVRFIGPTGAPFSRGGGRTLHIGQTDMYRTGDPAWGSGLWDGKQDSVSRNRAAWRLADVFSTRGDIEIPGLININGVNRDQGIALRAALNGLIFMPTPNGDPNLGGSSVNMDTLISALTERLNGSPATNPAFMERGELSELAAGNQPFFSKGAGLAGTEMAKVNDRGREELFRRLVELITTKGNVFTVHCIGQALQVTRSDDPARQIRVVSTVRKKVTFAIEPVYDKKLPRDEEFEPASEGNTGPAGRFRRPDRFEFRVLAESVIP